MEGYKVSMYLMGAELFIIVCGSLGDFWKEWLGLVVELLVGVLKLIEGDC